MTVPRILHGLDRVPSTLAPDDERLPAVILSAAPLRLNSEPLPADAWGAAEADHTTRVEAVRAWLLADCGDYNAALRRGVARYLDAIAAHVAHHHDALTTGLARFHGLYRAEDWYWSAPRPLPRAWWHQDGAWVRADLAFWDGDTVIAMRARDFDSGDLPAPLRRFWLGQTLPVSPFRRAFPTSTASPSPATSSPGLNR